MKIKRGTKLRTINLSRKYVPCPTCETQSKRHSFCERYLSEVGITTPRTMLRVIFSKHYCKNCKKYFSQPMTHLAQPNARYTNRVRRTAVELVTKSKMTLRAASEKMKNKYNCKVPTTTIHDWVVDEEMVE